MSIRSLRQLNLSSNCCLSSSPFNDSSRPDALLNERFVNRQPLSYDYGPVVGRGLIVGRTSVFRDPDLEDGESSSRPQSARVQYLGQQGRAPSLAPTQRLPSITENSHLPDELRSQGKKFDWIHIPFNNPIWVEKVFETLSVKDGKSYAELFGAVHWGSRHTRARHPQHHACFLKTTCGTIPSQEAPIQECRYLYLPYLHFDSYKSVIRRRNLIKQRLEQGRTNPTPSWVSDEASLELKLTWAFLGHDPPINCRRTLDQYQYPSIHDTRARDDDQVLYKLTKERLSASMNTLSAQTEEDDVLNGNLLMVDQLWIWILERPDHKCEYAIHF